MNRSWYHLVVPALLLLAGCAGTPGAPASPTPSATETRSAAALGDLSIEAEQTRIERSAAEYDNITGLSFGALEPAETEVQQRNRTGATVRVNVGYSVEFDCDGDDEPDSSVDGANTITTYHVTENRSQLVTVSQDFLDPDRYC